MTIDNKTILSNNILKSFSNEFGFIDEDSVLLRLDNNLQKGFIDNDLYDDVIDQLGWYLEKAGRDIKKLAKRIIVDKNGVRRAVYVRLEHGDDNVLKKLKEHDKKGELHKIVETLSEKKLSQGVKEKLKAEGLHHIVDHVQKNDLEHENNQLHEKKRAEKQEKYDKELTERLESEEQKKAEKILKKQEKTNSISEPSNINETKQFNTSLEDLRKLAYDAHRGTSFVPEKRADSFVKEYGEILTNDIEILKKREESNENIQNYIDKYKQKISSYLSSRGRVLSTMITGGSNFNVGRNEKALRAEQNKYNEFSDWRDKVLNRKIKTEKITPDSELGKAVKELEEAKKLQNIMIESNKIIRSKKDVTNRLMQLGLSEKTANELQNPDFAGRYGFATFQTTNNNAKIKRLEDRVNELTKKIEKRESGKEEKYIFDGGELELNRKEDRIQITFPNKPERQMIDKLKSNGYHWSPTNGAWQRKITNNALYNLKHFLNLPNLKKKEQEQELMDLPNIEQDFNIINTETNKSFNPTFFNISKNNIYKSFQ